MPRRHRDDAPQPSSTTPAPFIIVETGIYTPAFVRQALSLKASTLRTEIRRGRLSVCKRAGRYFFIGRQLLAWLEGGELRRRPAVHRDEPAA